MLCLRFPTYLLDDLFLLPPCLPHLLLPILFLLLFSSLHSHSIPLFWTLFFNSSYLLLTIPSLLHYNKQLLSHLFLSIPSLHYNHEQLTGSTWKSVSVSALQGSVIQFHALTVLTEAVAYLSAINGVIVKTGTSHC